jgi:hypothetical protein
MKPKRQSKGGNLVNQFHSVIVLFLYFHTQRISYLRAVDNDNILVDGINIAYL